MNEKDYICATNRVKISAALTLVRDVLPGEEWGISNEEHQKICGILRDAEVKLFASFELEDTKS